MRRGDLLGRDGIGYNWSMNLPPPNDPKPTEAKPAERERGGLNFAAGEAYLAARGITNPVLFIADDFDAPLPEDFLLRPLPDANF